MGTTKGFLLGLITGGAIAWWLKDSLLEQTRRRTALLVDPSHTLLVLTRAHEAFYAPLLGKTTTATAVVQPLGRGTASAIL